MPPLSEIGTVLLVDVSKIPPEGLELREELGPGAPIVPPEEEFSLEPGGSLACRVELGDEDTVHVQGRLAARLVLSCGRCLEPFSLAVDQPLELFCLPHRPDQEEEDEVELTERDMVVAYYRDRQVDLGEMVREQFYLAVPMKRLCAEGCKGLCPSCGANRNRQSCDCVLAPAEKHLASLARLLK